MKTYKIKGMNNYNGNSGEWNIDAENEEELRSSFFCSGLTIESIELVGDSQNDYHMNSHEQFVEKNIPDAEALLYEMDANKIDEISTREGMGESEKKYTRIEVEEYLGLNNKGDNKMGNKNRKLRVFKNLSELREYEESHSMGKWWSYEEDEFNGEYPGYEDYVAVCAYEYFD